MGGGGSAAIQVDEAADECTEPDFFGFVPGLFADEELVDEVTGLAGRGGGQAAGSDFVGAKGKALEEPENGGSAADEFDLNGYAGSGVRGGRGGGEKLRGGGGDGLDE
jgi:hypothetical protein